MKRYRVKIMYKLGKYMVLAGHVVEQSPTSVQPGFRFFPITTAHSPSRKSWPTPEKALPSWVKRAGYELEEVQS